MHLNPTAPLPSPKPTQHLIRVLACALNPVDYKPVEALPFVKRFLTPHAATPGLDFAGVVVRVSETAGSDSEGKTAREIKEGDIVFGVAGTGTPFAGGALSEYAVSKAGNCVLVPEGVDPVDTATIGVAGLTAYQSIVPFVKRGSRVFINGGSGGTGCFGVQIAKAVGCHVVATCSGGNVALLKGLGCDEVVDYTDMKEGKVWERLKKMGGGFDHVVDNVSGDGELYFRGHEYMKEEAVFVIVGGTPSLGLFLAGLERKFRPGFLGGGRRKYVGFFPHPEPAHLTQIADWIREGKVKAVVDQRFGFEQAVEAIVRLKTGRAKGKIVVDVGTL